MSGIPFKGASSTADNRFTDKEKKLLKSMKFPKEYDTKVDFKKVKWEVMKTWIATRVTELLGIEDEVLIGYIYEQLEGKKTIDPRILQINLTGFLEKNTSLFVKTIAGFRIIYGLRVELLQELWALLASAGETESGIPQKLLDDKAEELKRKKEMQVKINERLAKEKEKREAQRREETRKEEEIREQRRREREKEREEERERERDLARKRRERQREEWEKRRERERAVEAERQKEREARRVEERARQRRRDEERAKATEHRRKEVAIESSEAAEQPKASPSGSPPIVSENEKKRSGEAIKVEEDGPAAKKAKKEKKEKKAKDKKEKKEKVKKEKKVKEEPVSPSSNPESLQDRKQSLEDELRQKALLSVQKN